MSAIFILIGASLCIATGFLIAFIRSAKTGQFDDSYTPSVRILFDDTRKEQEIRKDERAGTREDFQATKN